MYVLTLMLLLPAPLVWFEDWSQNPKTKGLLPFLLYVAAPGLATQSDAMQSDASILIIQKLVRARYSSSRSTRTEPRADPLKTSRPSVEKDGLQHRQHRKCKSAKTAYVQSGVICNLLACYPCTCRSVQLQYPTFLFQLKFTFSPLKF